MDETALCGTVYKISWFSEVRRLKSWILAIIPNGNQFFFEQWHYIYGVFLRGQTEKDSANMGSHAEIHLIFMLCISMC